MVQSLLPSIDTVFLSECQQEFFHSVEHMAMSFGIEMSGVGRRLEETLAKLVAAHMHPTLPRGVEHRYGMAATNILHDVDDLHESRFVNVPGRDERYFRRGIFINEEATQAVETISHHLKRILIVSRLDGIVVPSDDDDIIRGVRHLLIPDEQRGSEPLSGAVESDASAIAAIVSVIHPMLLREEIVPCLLKRTTMVAHVAVAEHENSLPRKWFLILIWGLRVHGQRKQKHGERTAEIFHGKKV